MHFVGTALTRVVSSLLALALGACASLPEVDPLLQQADAKARPSVGKADGTTSVAGDRQLVALLDRQSADFAHHLAIEEEVSGTRLTAGNSALLLQDGPASFQALFAALEQARDSINLEYYIIENDALGERLVEVLLRKRQQGVKINLIYDSVGSNGTPRAYFDRLRDAGVQVVEFNPINPLAVGKRGWDINQRDHRKIVVIDGRVAFTGGINISGVYAHGSRGSGGPSGGSGFPSGGGRARHAPLVADLADGARRPGWRDTNIEIKGPAVAEFQRLFAATWEQQTGTPLQAADYFPALDATHAGELLVHVVGSSPDHPVPAMYVTLISALTHARKSIHIAMAYFTPDPQTLRALAAAAQRGVDVKLILPSYSDFWGTFYAGRAHYGALLDGGVQIFERQGALLHAKTIVIDGVWSTVGSSNLDWRSFLHNNEVNAVVLGTTFGGQMDAAFTRDLGNSLRVTADQWRERSLDERFKELGARIWEYWF